MKVGVFDSGRGGLSVAQAIAKALPAIKVDFRDDHEHLPYGTREPEEILGFVVPIFEDMIKDGCQVIVVACNTVSTTLIEELRSRFRVPLVATEPMVKPAAEMTKTGVIAVCATPTTLASRRYGELKDLYVKDIKVVEPDCSDWTQMIEDNKVNYAIISERINQVLDQKADVNCASLYSLPLD